MERIRFVDYKGQRVLIEDFSNLTPGPEFFAVIETAQRIITSQPPKSVLAVLDASGTRFNTEVINRMKDFVKANSPYIRCSAVVGVTGLLNVALMTLSNVRGQSFKSFDDRASALEFVIK